MIKRVKTAPAAPMRRGLLPRLRNARIRSKLGLILVIPIAALVGIALVRLAEAGQSVVQSQGTLKYAVLSQEAAALSENLQIERSLATLLLTSAPRQQQRIEGQYEAQWKLTDQQVEAYELAREELGTLSPNTRELLDRIGAQLAELDRLRYVVTDRDKITLSSAIFRYRIMIADLLAYRESLSNLAGETEAADLARAAAAISSYGEYMSQEQVVGLRLLAGHEPLTPVQQEAFLATLAGQSESLRAFGNVAEERHVADLLRGVAGRGVGKDAAVQLGHRLADKSNSEVEADAQRAQRFESDFRRAVPGQPVALSSNAGPFAWSEAMFTRVALTREVERRLDEELQAHVQALQNALIRQLVAEGLTVLIVLFFAVLIALLIARSMASSLRRLREGALSVAYESLPQSVARLRNPETLGEMTPDQVAASVKDPVQVRGRDEIGQVSQAFNVVHREAVRIAAEQAALRANVATMFINLARRSQVLVDRLIGHLDRLERGEEDPDRLAELFQLDHLATRMRRNDENLLVLAGADSTRVQRDPAPLSDVLRAAQSEVEQYTRIEFGIVDRDVEVAQHAVNDVVHLLAELFDNATSFSPPDTVVVVDARRAGDRAILQIEDRGIGISAEQLAELNTRLANPPLVDVAVSRMMGLVVVGRLAARHGIRVELRAARDRGTIADVILPAAALILPYRAGRQQTMGLPQGRSPLALESSPETVSRQGGGHPPEHETFWSPPGGAGYGQSPGWDRGMEPASAPPMPPGTPVASGMNGVNGSADRQLPRRRPGEGSTGGQHVEVGPPGADGMPGARPQAPAQEVFSRQPAAEPGPNPYSTRPGAPGRESIHSVELPSARQAAPTRPGPGDSRGPGGYLGTTGMSSASGYPAPAGAARTKPTGGLPGYEPPPVTPNADDTMELPIFREVESAWFRTKQPRRGAPQGAADQGAGSRSNPVATTSSAGMAKATAPASAPRSRGASVPGTDNGSQVGAMSAPHAAGMADQGSWQTAADDGWRAASAAADAVGAGITNVGLPKRVPMAQLVPGGVENDTTGTRNRSPDAVRGLLSAYHRGVQRGRQSSARTSSDEGPGKEQA
ncbi:MAG TPA: nitrate- and nitrite sensing domain-containing protein [Micromonosporaceae bacterium]